MLSYRYLSVVESTSAVKNQLQDCSVCFDRSELQFPFHGCVLPGKNFGQRCLQKL